MARLFTRTHRTSGCPALLGPLALLLLTGCASTAPRPGPQNATEQTLRAEVETWRGTPHQWGGIDRGGADCSGFVMKLYHDLFGADVPRTTIQQAKAGAGVRRQALQPGDLVFFRPTRKTRHVGVYLGEGEFAHVSSSVGVTVSRLDQPYWQRIYWRARRLPQAAPLRASRPEPAAAKASFKTPSTGAPGSW
ncbi:MAG: C40 family peptidase [Rhodothermales bacterium]